ncbi:uncharacterized protein LOC114529346 isoform X2 [Dendronephthya gigantea]|uniref:uncharacterized protein LOC114529346 isoform X2 n=1 Tax=Dendronephthya gigantea TaxID=151771 RepID=UPI00106BFD50|nr:uncharacterized protein LOC114529346 isoform X2 [Dendronephthya gigantea]
MFRFLLLFQLIVFVKARTRFDFEDEIFDDLLKQQLNDPNLNPGFDLDAFRQNQLNLHNYYRSLHGVPAMTLNETLTSQAQSYAELLAEKNIFEHCADDKKDDINNEVSSCEEKGTCCYGAGENLATAFGSTRAETNATKNWYDEIWDYNFCFDRGDSSESKKRPGHEDKDIGHFTQVVWKDSLQLGIGYARSADRTKVYVVARYTPPGNFIDDGQHTENVKVPGYILDTFQNNCDGVNGSLSDWMDPGPCTRSCGGGIKFRTKTCTNPKPSLNGRDCEGPTKELAAREWCNTHPCSETTHHRDQQCLARGYTTGRHHIFPNEQCNLLCFVEGSNLLSRAGHVDDGTHCDGGSGACVSGICLDMPEYVPGTAPPSTTALPTTLAPETTTPEPPTTPEPETTTPEPSTPPEPETTTTEPETTTTEPETTTTEPPTPPEPETTTTEPETTTTEPETTTPEPETTTTEPPTPPEPETTTTEPETTTTEPETTTTETTTPEPETTTTEPPTPPEPETTTPEPETTTPEPETTTTEPPTPPEPETTTPEPETTTTEPPTPPEPETTTTEPETTTTEPPTTPMTTPSPIKSEIARGLLRYRARPRLLFTVPSGASQIQFAKFKRTGSRINRGVRFFFRLLKENGEVKSYRLTLFNRRVLSRYTVPAGCELKFYAFTRRCFRIRIRTRGGRFRRICRRVPFLVRLTYRKP